MCSACLKEGYCSLGYQKLDWVHKILCPYMKKDKELLPFTEVAAITSELEEQAKLTKEIERKIQFLIYCLSFAEYQFGSRIIGKIFRERDGCRVENWEVEVDCFLKIIEKNNSEFRELLRKHVSGGDAAKINEAMYTSIHYYKQSIAILEPWSIQIESTKSEGNERSEWKIDQIYDVLSYVETKLATCYRTLDNRNEEEIYYYEKAIMHSMRLKIRDRRTKLLCDALRCKASSLSKQGKLIDAKGIYEDANSLLAEAYNPIHPGSRGWTLSDHNTSIDFCRSFIFSDPKVATAPQYHLKLLFEILQLKEGHDVEVKGLLERELNILILRHSIESEKVFLSNTSSSEFHKSMADKLPPGAAARNELLHEAIRYCKEALRISITVNGPTHEDTLQLQLTLSETMELLDQNSYSNSKKSSITSIIA